MARVTVDGRTADFPEGTTLLEAARTLGVDIPTLCTVTGLAPDPVCRVCSVEVSHPAWPSARMLTACSRRVQDGMQVATRSERTIHHRQLLLEMLLARSPEVQAVRELAAREGVTSTRFSRAPDDCILCGRCVRACREVSGAEVLGYTGRGMARRVSVPYDEPSSECIECAACGRLCPTGCITVEDPDGRRVRHEELTLGPNSAIRVGTYQAVPNKPYVDPEACIHVRTGACGVCREVCGAGAIVLDDAERTETIQVGSIVVASGFRVFDPSRMQRYGYGRLRNVVTTLELERMLNASGPTGGRVLLADGTEPRSVAFVHCVGSRDRAEHEYCSRVCCMVAMKQGHLVHERTGAQVYSFYIDLRCFGKGYEEFYHRLLAEGTQFVRGKVASVDQAPEGEEGLLLVRAEDTLLGAILTVPVDMVVLAVGLEASDGTSDLARTLRLSIGRDGWLLEQHPKLGPVSTAVEGVFLAGACQGPKDIPDSVAQGLAAAARALALADRGVVEIDGATAHIDPDVCAGCRECSELCPSGAIAYDETLGVCVVDERICAGCGACAAQCRSGAAEARHFTDEQVMAEIEEVLG